MPGLLQRGGAAVRQVRTFSETASDLGQGLVEAQK